MKIFAAVKAGVLTGMLITLSAVGGAQAATVKALVLTQQSDFYGHVVSTITPTGLRVDVSGKKAFLVARAPEWKVMVCNTDNKKALTMTHDEWLRHVPVNNYMGSDWNRYRIGHSSRPGTVSGGFAISNFVFPVDVKPGEKPIHKGYMAQMGGANHWVSTSKIEHKNVDPAIFVYPVGYTPVSKEVEVLTDSATHGAVKEVLQDLLPN